MVKVCHITSAHPPEDVRIFKKECTSLANYGYDVYLVQQGGSYEKDGVHIVGFGEKFGGRIKRMTKYAHKAYNIALNIDADLYHIHDPELLPYAKKLKLLGKKVIFDSHENVIESIKEKEWIPSLIRSTVYETLKLYQDYIFKYLDAVIVVTPNALKYLGVNRPETEIITNYPIYQEPKIMPDFHKRVLVFAGGVSEQWSHKNIINSISKIKDCQYNLCGKATPKYLSELVQLQSWKNVNYFGSIPHEKVGEFLGNSYIGLALLKPSNNTDWQQGTLGNTKIFEEMMAGLPVICTNFELWKQFEDKYKCAICINPDSEKELIRAIEYLFNNPKVAQKMGKNGRMAVKNYFSWDGEEKKLFNLYKKLLNIL